LNAPDKNPVFSALAASVFGGGVGALSCAEAISQKHVIGDAANSIYSKYFFIVLVRKVLFHVKILSQKKKNKQLLFC
jgi:hypothetical protein